MDLHPDVLRLALLGWRLHPVSRRMRAAFFAKAATLATSDLDQLAPWSRWRVVIDGSGIWALEVDVPSVRHKHDAVAALRELIAVHGPLPVCPTTRSGDGRLALFFAHRSEPIIGKAGHPALGMDPRRGRQARRFLFSPTEFACARPPPSFEGELLMRNQDRVLRADKRRASAQRAAMKVTTIDRLAAAVARNTVIWPTDDGSAKLLAIAPAAIARFRAEAAGTQL